MLLVKIFPLVAFLGGAAAAPLDSNNGGAGTDPSMPANAAPSYEAARYSGAAKPAHNYIGQFQNDVVDVTGKGAEGELEASDDSPEARSWMEQWDVSEISERSYKQELTDWYNQGHVTGNTQRQRSFVQYVISLFRKDNPDSNIFMVHDVPEIGWGIQDPNVYSEWFSIRLRNMNVEKYRVFVFKGTGTLDNIGDGGHENWAWDGWWDREGNKVTFKSA